MSRERQADERDVLKVLTVLAAESRVYRLHLEQARPVIERLAEDMEDVAVGMLATSIVAALAEPAHLGTARHVEQLALQVYRGLPAASPG